MINKDDMPQQSDGKTDVISQLRIAKERIADLEELHRMQLAAVTAAVMQNTRSTAADRIGKENPYWTPAYQDVCDAVDREMNHREKLEAFKQHCAKHHALPDICCPDV